MQLFELPNFAIGSPTGIAVPGFPQIRLRELAKTARSVEARRHLVGERLIVDEGISVR